MKRHASQSGRMQRIHLPQVHATHLHPIHWLSEHPLVLALLIAGLTALFLVILASLTDTGVRTETLRPLGTQAAYPYGSGREF